MCQMTVLYVTFESLRDRAIGQTIICPPPHVRLSSEIDRHQRTCLAYRKLQPVPNRNYLVISHHNSLFLGLFFPRPRHSNELRRSSKATRNTRPPCLADRHVL